MGLGSIIADASVFEWLGGVVLWSLAGYGLMFITWILYLAIMNIAAHRQELYPIARIHAYVLLIIGIAFDVVLNVTVGTILFLELPSLKRLLLTARLDQQARHGHGWRKTLAQWICTHLLNQFDPNGHHCGYVPNRFMDRIGEAQD